MSASYGSLVNSVSLYVDTSDRIHRGNDVNLQINPPLHIGDIPGASYKVTLTEFFMHRPTYTVDATNDAFSIRTLNTLQPPGAPPNALAAAVGLTMLQGNKRSVHAIADAFATALRAQLNAEGRNVTGFVVNSPAVDETEESTGTMLLDVTFTIGVGGHNLNELLIQLFDTSDAYILLGGDRVADDSVQSSLTVDLLIPNTIRIRGRYPMQLTSLKHVYVRTDLTNTSLQSSSLNGVRAPSTHTINSNILAKIPMELRDVSYAAFYDEFFITLPQHTISSIRLFLTDHKGRPLAMLGANHATTGPMHFTATLRIDTIMRTPPGTLKTRPIPKTVPTSKLGPFYATNDMLHDE